MTGMLKYCAGVILIALILTGCAEYDERLICRYPIVQTRAQMALNVLQRGNERYMYGEAVHPNQTLQRREQQAGAHQSPAAAVLACADSRVPVELIFDMGIGDLFVVRSAGNAWSVSNVGSLEYAVINLDVPLIVVLGHTNCGAVDAAWLEGRYENQLGELLTPLFNVVRAYKQQYPEHSGPHDAVGIQAVTRANAHRCVSDILANSPDIKTKYDAGYIEIIPAEYDLATGEVIWLDGLRQAQAAP